MCPLFGQPVTLSKSDQTVAKHDEASTAAQVASLAADFTPFLGSGKSVYELFSGSDPITGEAVNRWMSAAGIILGIVPGGKALIKGKKATKLAKKALKKPATKGASKKGIKAANDNVKGKKAIEAANDNVKQVYEPAPYHGKANQGLKSRGPTNGQAALENSVQVKPTSPRRVSVDKESGEFVVFDRHEAFPHDKFHGHVREWNDLGQDMQNALIKSNQVTGKGKIIK
ncbi:MAG: pre-toxin TG domain-containing protein [Candidatus Protochlamydia sp.]|nr:pre-toxin TG domain-containing protein [Candidatus Protochlamydia sp.]